MKNFKLGKKAYFGAFVFVMILNVGLGIFLIKNVLAQSSDDKLKKQPPIKAEVIEQKDSPILITVANVDNSDDFFQRVTYSVQNIGNKPIRAYTILTEKIVTTIPTTKLFQVGESKSEDLFVERQNIKSPEIFLSVDYVEFEDGSFWGKDTQKESERIAGERVGRKKAIEELKNLLNGKDFTTVKNLLEQDIKKLSVTVSDSSQTEKWQKGFQSGYKVVISVLQQQKNQGIEAILQRLNEIETLVK